MKLPPFSRSTFSSRHADPARARDVAATINATLARALRDAGLDATGGVPAAVRATIDDALAAAGLRAPVPPTSAGKTFDGVASVVPADDVDVLERDADLADVATEGRFSAGSFTNAAGTRAYKLWVPAGTSEPARPRALVMMLHGCTQSPDDFAAGTRMNAIADREGLVVLYPAQDAGANGSRCWNWFRPQDQEREHGEPAILAGMARAIAAEHGIPTGHVFVAGLSAGAGMAVILGATHPDVFAAVGAHSGLPYRSAHDMPSAFAVMHGRQRPRDAAQADQPLVPTIVFHGDADKTVIPANGAAILGRLRAADDQHFQSSRHDGRSADGVRYRRTVHADARGHPVAEHWVLEGVGHAWSGGSTAGSFTHPRGPDASAEMIRFFRSTARSGNA